MDVISSKEEIIFKNEHDGKVLYSIGLSKKNQDGTYDRGYMSVRFKKDVTLEDKTKIKIRNAWLDFYKVEKKTLPYIFISEYEIVKQESKEKIGDPKDIEIPEEDLPFFG